MISNIIKSIKKYLIIQPRPIYDPYNYPHTKPNIIDISNDGCNIKYDVANIDLLRMFQTRGIEVVNTKVSNYDSIIRYEIRIDDTDDLPPSDIVEYYDQYFGSYLAKIRHKYKIRYGLTSTRLYLHQMNIEKQKAIVLSDKPISLSESSRNYRLTGNQSVETVDIAYITLDIETSII
jgi:hypothetical protein